MIWISQTTIPGIISGMIPYVVGLLLLIVFVIDITLILIFRKKIKSLKSKVISLIIGFFIYELVMWVLGGDIVLFESFKKSFTENTDGAFSFSSIFALLIILGLIFINKRITDKKTLHNHV
ncbi:hypothetical protein [Ulvibacter antarcticus]|uniref:Uncharacterized protein n=1 Tax=Ulvibacter antarcticus TaxID=442714 RepID=A0A3L9ZB93_9FLAO|nr:hypothetical protein [Ulvibacter antarcticus]RMA67718.1 hypothetical protein BXY75_0028 [Ulvibacter antarcticus]